MFTICHRLPNLTCACSQVNIDDGFLNLMTQDGTAKDDVRLPEGELGKQIQDEFDAGKDLLVTIVSAMGEEQVSITLRSGYYVYLGAHTCVLVTQAISFKEAPKGA